MDFRILGPLEVRDGERIVSIRRGKHQALLAALLLRTGEPVSVDQLLDDLWGERPPSTAKGSLQNMVSALRKTLGEPLLRTQSPGYLLDIEREQVDLFRFERLLREAREADGAEDRAERLRDAIALWRGAPFADLAFEPFALLEAPRLEELHLAARAELIEARLALGDEHELIPELETLVAQQPFNERLRGQLMVVLYRVGRQADALDGYQEGRRLLVEELGLEPSTSLRELEQAILRHDPALAPPRPQRPALLPTRRTATALYADLVASGAHSTQLDPEALDQLLTRYAAVAERAIDRNGGTVESLPGSAIFAVFGVPRAHEDDALRALRAAVELRDELEILGGELESRVGISTGEVFAGGHSGPVTGAVVTVARQLNGAASAGDILLGATTVQLVRGAAHLEPLPPLVLAEDKPLGVWRVLELIASAPAIPRRFQAPLVGRCKEMARLNAEFEAVRDGSRCRLLVLAGEPGIGKTRLTQQFLEEVAREATVLVGRCASYGEGATWLPMLEIFREIGLENKEAISSLLSAEPDGELLAQHIAASIGFTEEATSLEETKWAFRRLFEVLATGQPLVVVFEDVHWAEPTLLELIEQLAERASRPMLLLCLTRPELVETRAAWVEGALTLAALSEVEVGTLVAGVQAELDAGVRARVIELAEGNPLFAEQLVAYACEEGIESLALAPPSIEALLASRLDLLSGEERALVEVAAVIGRRFSRTALLDLSTADASTASLLRLLTEKGLIGPSAEDDTLSFHHELVRTVAYSNIPKRARAELHERFAAWLKERSADLVELDEIIGYHLEQAATYKHELNEPDPVLAERASVSLAAAGRRALWRGDLAAAANLLERALALTPPARLDLHLELDLAMARRESAPERAVAIAEAAARRAHERGDKAGEALASVVAARDRMPIAEKPDPDGLETLARRALPVLERAGDHAGLVQVWLAIGSVASQRGRYEERACIAEHALRHARLAGLRPRIVFGLDFALVLGPRPADDALRVLEAALPKDAHPGALLNRARLLAMLRRVDEARALAHDANARYRELTGKDSGYIPAEVATIAGDHAAAVGYLQAFCGWCEEHHQRALLSTYAPTLGRSLCALGRYDEAEPYADLGRKLGDGQDISAQMLWRQVKALVQASRGEHAQAEQLAREAVAIGEQTDAINTQGDALCDLAEVLESAGRNDATVVALEQALARYERKRNLVMAERVRARLDEHRPASLPAG
jgi:DNA-binding SARP family transcriptional activator/tetratricopeptide (TPR) repeat protein